MSSAAQFRGPLQVEYCPVCSMPPEYCEFGPSWERCKVVLEKKHPELLEAALAKMNVGGAPAGAAAAAASSSAAAAPAQADKKKKKAAGSDDEDDDDSDDEEESKGAAGGDDEFLAAAAPVKPLKKAAASAGPGIYMSLSQRSKKKFVTTIRGWESFGLVLKDVSKLLSKKFACAASVVKAADGTGEIAMQGDILMDLPAWIVDEFPQVDKKLIWTVDKAGKKVRAF